MIPLLPAEFAVWIARTTLGLTLLVSGLGKLRDLDGVVIGVLRYEIGPPRTMRRLAPLLPMAELLLAVLLLVGFAVRWAAVGASLLLAVFAMAVIVNLRRDRPIACHCYGASADERIGAVTLLRLLVLGVAGVVVAAESPVAAGVLPAAASLADTLRLAGIAVYAAGALRMLGPAATLWRDVLATRRARRPHRGAGRARQRGLRMERGAGVAGDQVLGGARADREAVRGRG